MTAQQELITEIDRLISTHYDASEGFRKVADISSNPTLIKLFNDYADKHDRQRSILEKEAILFGAQPKFDGTIPAKAHRAWIDLNILLSAKEETILLDACLTGLSYSKEYFENFLQDNTVPPRTEKIIRQQYSELLDTISVIEKTKSIKA